MAFLFSNVSCLDTKQRKPPPRNVIGWGDFSDCTFFYLEITPNMTKSGVHFVQCPSEPLDHTHNDRISH